MSKPLTDSQRRALDQLYSGSGYACSAGITNSTNAALAKRGLARIETKRGRYGFEFKWKLTDEGKAAGRERAAKQSEFHKRIDALLARPAAEQQTGVK